MNHKQHSPAFLRLAEAARQRVEEVTIAAVKAKLDRGDDFLLIDVREDHEWEKGHIPGAIHLGRGILERDVEAQIVDCDREIVLYCGGGYRSALAAESLGKMGYRRVFSMAGGWRAWQEAALATVAPTGRGS